MDGAVSTTECTTPGFVQSLRYHASKSTHLSDGPSGVRSGIPTIRIQNGEALGANPPLRGNAFVQAAQGILDVHPNEGCAVRRDNQPDG